MNYGSNVLYVEWRRQESFDMALPRLLMEALELHSLLQCGDPVVIADCRFSLADPAAGEIRYAESHIPSAAYVHLDRDLAAPRAQTGGRHPLPGAAAFQSAMQRIGLDQNSLLVAYDDSRGSFAARLWWLARYFGHTQVCLLNGGIAAWSKAGLALDRQVPVMRQGNFVARENTAMVVNHDAVRLASDNGSFTLIDAREARRFQGIEEPIDPVAGHIPGAINRPWADAVDGGGRFLAREKQAARWHGVGDGAEVMMYCGSGVTACVNLLSMELAGLPGGRLYAGSWSDWISYANAPVATGE
jgi:thiosulfate/3-mercaptopyruvate sulfurtransferase